MKKFIWKWFVCFCLLAGLLFSVGCGKAEPVQEPAAEQQNEITSEITETVQT